MGNFSSSNGRRNSQSPRSASHADKELATGPTGRLHTRRPSGLFTYLLTPTTRLGWTDQLHCSISLTKQRQRVAPSRSSTARVPIAGFARAHLVYCVPRSVRVGIEWTHWHVDPQAPTHRTTLHWRPPKLRNCPSERRETLVTIEIDT